MALDKHKTVKKHVVEHIRHKEEIEEEPIIELHKSEGHCVVEGCTELKEPGQTYVCSKHVRSN